MTFNLKTTAFIQNDKFLLGENKYVSLNLYELLKNNQININPDFTVSNDDYTLYKSPNITDPVIGFDEVAVIQEAITAGIQLKFKLDSATLPAGSGLYLSLFKFRVTYGDPAEYEDFRIEIYTPVADMETGVIPDPDLP